MTIAITITLVIIALVFFAAAFISSLRSAHKKALEESYWEMSDKELLLFVDSQPDKLLDADMVARSTSLSTKEAKMRIRNLTYKGLLKIASSHGGFKYYYSLIQPIRKGPYPTLSSDPFLTVSDLMILFKFFDYRLSLQDICLSTGLPINVIKEEMKYFVKKEIIKQVTARVGDGVTYLSSARFYILMDPYRSNPDAYLEQEEEIDLDLGEIYNKSGLRDKME